MIYKILLFVGVAFNVIAQFFLKFAMKNSSLIEDKASFIKKLIPLLLKPSFFLSIMFYGCGFLIYSVALSKLELSKAYPVSSVTAIVLIFIISLIFLSETINIYKIIGIISCIFGIFMIFKQ